MRKYSSDSRHFLSIKKWKGTLLQLRNWTNVVFLRQFMLELEIKNHKSLDDVYLD